MQSQNRGGKHATTSKYSHERIRNVIGFLKSYMQGERGKMMLTRPIRYREETAPGYKNKPVTHRLPVGYNTLAHAFGAATA